tara:strand:- start:224 stop:934 length:711 start_codon:yes stop_codon:yes gene_type:complete
MSTYLELCQDMARDVGIPGDGPSSVTSTSLSEEENAVVRYIKTADQDIQSRWFDWDYLWSEATITASSGTSTLTSSNSGFPSSLGNWRLDSFVWNKSSDDYQILEYVPWNEYREDYKYGTIDSDIPEVFTVKPDNTIDLYPTPNASVAVSAEYWSTPTLLSSDSQVSEIPARFHRIIIARAKMFYAENEDAPEIMVSSLSEFEDQLDKLEADQLPRQKNRRFSSAQDSFNFVVRPI